MKRSTFASFAWLLTGYTVVVILWGAFVRATGSGAGCGSHWPLCNGEVIPHSPGVETLIELGHRLSSGLLGICVLTLVLAAFRAYPRGHRVRQGAMWTLLFVVTESLLGAGLVTFEWVAANDSQERVYVMAFHLVNTFLLLAVMTLTAWFANGGGPVRLRGRPPGNSRFCTRSKRVLRPSGESDSTHRHQGTPCRCSKRPHGSRNRFGESTGGDCALR